VDSTCDGGGALTVRSFLKSAAGKRYLSASEGKHQSMSLQDWGGETDYPSREAEEFQIDGQWYVRGNISPSWFACASRVPGGPRSGIAARLPRDLWPVLEQIAELRRKLS
jgi:hypothetical protein